MNNRKSDTQFRIFTLYGLYKNNRIARTLQVITINIGVKAKSVFIYSISGQMIKSISNFNGQVPISDLEKETYIVLVNTDMETFKIKLLKK